MSWLASSYTAERQRNLDRDQTRAAPIRPDRRWGDRGLIDFRNGADGPCVDVKSMTVTKHKKSNDDLISVSLAMPRRPARGRPSVADQAIYETRLDHWCAGIIAMSEQRAAQPDDFAVSSRGWCYLLEEHGLFKDDFDTAQELINACRKNGRLPLDICADVEG